MMQHACSIESQLTPPPWMLQERVWWFSSMLGKKATLKATRLLLHQLGVPCLRTTEFVQVSC